MTALHDLSVLEQRDALRAGEIKATDLTEHYLERITAHDEALGAFAHRTDQLARREAEAADEELRSDTDPPPLLGVPFAFKDLFPVAGVPLTMGSTAIDPVVPAEDGWVIGLLRRAGVVALGTTHAPEFGAPCYTHSAVVGRPAVTPYDTERSASGSSGGTAAAVAAGLTPAGHGSDGAGSIRSPAAACGLVGLKPTRGLVSTAPTASFQGWPTEGVLTRTVADTGLLLDVIARPSPADIHRWPQSEASFLGAARRPPAGPLRAAVWTESGLAGPDPDTLAAVQRTVRLLEDLGHHVEEIDNPVPWTEESLQAFLAVFGGLAAAIIGHLVPEDRIDRLAVETRWLLDLGSTRSAAQHVAATDGLAALAAGFLAAVAPYDVVLTPVTNGPAVPVGWFHEEGEDAIWSRMADWSAYTPMANMTGQPALACPVHETDDGLPVGVQLIGPRHGDDALLLSLAGQLERATGWTQRHPPQWRRS